MNTRSQHRPLDIGDDQPEWARIVEMQIDSGAVVDLLRPEQGLIRLGDLTLALARIPRFNGHTRGDPDRICSVAQHSVLVSELVPGDIALEALLHDIHESLTGDITRPLRDALQCSRLSAIQNGIQAAIHKALGLQWPLGKPTKQAIKRADLLALTLEVRDLMAPSKHWSRLPSAPDLLAPIKPMKPSEALALFEDRLEELCQKRNIQWREQL